MIIPEYLKKGAGIGVTATSDGVSDELDKVRFENGKKHLEELGFGVIFTENVFTADDKGRSSSGMERGKQFNELVAEKDIGAIIAAKGGNFLNEMLPYIDFERLVYQPKWFQGYSDNTGLIHTLTTKYDMAAVYGSNFGEFGMEPWHASVENNLAVLCGNQKEQYSFERYQREMTERVTGLEGYQEDTPVSWKMTPAPTGDKMQQKTEYKDNVKFQGRLLGGCLDVLIFLQGTRYDGTLEYIEKYKEDGILWYLESFDISGENLMMFLWQLKEIGWFRYTSGFIIGRPLFYKDFTNTAYEEAVLYALGDLSVPVIFDCDFGHRGPRMTILNGALAGVEYKEGKGILRYI